MEYWKKIIKIFNIVLLVFTLLIPLFLFLNRFLIPDMSFDSLNYHLFLGFKGFNFQNNNSEFFPTGIHNFSTVLEIPGYLLENILGYRFGSIGSLIFLYLSVFIVFKIFCLYKKGTELLKYWWSGILFANIFLSFESFLQISTYYVDIEVAFLMLSSLYFLLKYEKTKKIKDIVFSSIFTAVFVLGKMTSWYYLFPYFGYLFYILTTNNKIIFKRKIFIFFLTALISLSLFLPWAYKNYRESGNPVFPFYNAIFKSKYSNSRENFSQVIFGGRNLTEKLFWGIESIKYPVRLGEVHDLFNDYKINIYFITALLILIWSLAVKNKLMRKLSIFYLLIYFSWSYFFGYLRYGLVLEFLGALLLLLCFMEMKSIKKYLVLLPILFILIVQNKRIVNMSLAYDISFRPGYYYNRATYPKEMQNFRINKIEVDESIVSKFNPQVFLNCAIPQMTFYVLSDFNKLPVLNVDERAYSELTSNKYYVEKGENGVKKMINNDSLNFVTIVGDGGFNNTYSDCIKNLKKKDFIILDEEKIDNFLGYKNQKMVIIFGRINW